MYIQFDQLYSDIFNQVCAGCQDHDCEGYIWLLPEEAKTLYEAGITIVELNRSSFIHSFPEANGALRLDVMKPPCVLHKDKRCSIYTIRPLVCRMYPVGLITLNCQVAVVLHQECEFVRRLVGRKKEEFLLQIREILDGLSEEFVDDLVSCYHEVDTISHFPEGPNSYEVLFCLD